MRQPSYTVYHFFDLTRSDRFTENLFLYNAAAHLRSQTLRNWRVYEIINERTKKVAARISFNLQNGKALSPFRAPFGGLEVYDKVPLHDLVEFIRLVEADLVQQGIKSILIKSFASLYHQTASLVFDVFCEADYTHRKELTSVIPIDGKSFERKIKLSERQKLRKSKNLFQFKQIDQNHLQEIYCFLLACRHERNQTLSLSLKEIIKLGNLFSERIYLFNVHNQQGIAAACIALKVSDQVLYTFYYGHQKRYDKVSPVVWLMSGIYDFAQQNNFRCIDLGGTIVNGKMNRSLLHFKKSIGGVNSDKYYFEKVIS